MIGRRGEYVSVVMFITNVRDDGCFKGPPAHHVFVSRGKGWKERKNMGKNNEDPPRSDILSQFGMRVAYAWV